MRIVFTLVLTLTVSVLVYSQNYYNNENELHAPKIYPQNAVPFFKDYYDNPLYVNTNISQNSAPQNEPSVRISRINPDIVVAAWRDFRLGYQGSNIIRRIGYSYATESNTPPAGNIR